jgi:hypothetical protein
MTYRALLVGNSVFDADGGLNPLNAPVKDVARLHHALVNTDIGLFDDTQVRLVTERTSNDILDELDRFFDAGRKEDLLLFYYSGHGVLDERGQLYLCGRDTRSDRLLRTGVSNTRINEFIAQSACQRTVILLDCCSSGLFKGSGVGPQLAGPGRYIVSSTRGAALANDADTATGTSLFTEYLVKGMLGEATDSNHDGYIDLRDVYDYVRTRLSANTKQVPHSRFDGDADISLARVRVLPQLTRVPPEAKPRTSEPTFALAENVITLRDVEPDEQLSPEQIDLLTLTDDRVDLVATTKEAWLQPSIAEGQLTIQLHPRPGANRGKVTVRDTVSGTTQVLRVEVFIRTTPAASTAGPPHPSPSTTPLPAASTGLTAVGGKGQSSSGSAASVASPPSSEHSDYGASTLYGDHSSPPPKQANGETAPPPPADATPTSERRWWTKWWVWVIAAVVVIGTAIGIGAAGSSNPGPPGSAATGGPEAPPAGGGTTPANPDAGNTNSNNPDGVPTCDGSQLSGELTQSGDGLSLSITNNGGSACTLPEPVDLHLLDNGGQKIGSPSFSDQLRSLALQPNSSSPLAQSLSPCADGQPPDVASVETASASVQFRVTLGGSVQACIPSQGAP